MVLTAYIYNDTCSISLTLWQPDLRSRNAQKWTRTKHPAGKIKWILLAGLIISKICTMNLIVVEVAAIGKVYDGCSSQTSHHHSELDRCNADCDHWIQIWMSQWVHWQQHRMHSSIHRLLRIHCFSGCSLNINIFKK